MKPFAPDHGSSQENAADHIVRRRLQSSTTQTTRIKNLKTYQSSQQVNYYTHKNTRRDTLTDYIAEKKKTKDSHQINNSSIIARKNILHRRFFFQKQFFYCKDIIAHRHLYTKNFSLKFKY